MPGCYEGEIRFSLRSYLDAFFSKVHLHSEFLPKENIRVVSFLKRSFKQFELFFSKYRSVSSLTFRLRA